MSTTLLAGHPDFDFVTDALRESFNQGHAPKTSRMMPEGLWVCGSYDALGTLQSGKIGVTLGGAKFKYTAEGLMSKTSYYITEVPYYLENNSLASYRTRNSKKFYHFIRENHGGIIIERAQESLESNLPSAIMEGLQVTQYTYCLPYEKKSNREKVFNYAWDKILKE